MNEQDEKRLNERICPERTRREAEIVRLTARMRELEEIINNLEPNADYKRVLDEVARLKPFEEAARKYAAQWTPSEHLLSLLSGPAAELCKLCDFHPPHPELGFGMMVCWPGAKEHSIHSGILAGEFEGVWLVFDPETKQLIRLPDNYNCEPEK